MFSKVFSVIVRVLNLLTIILIGAFIVLKITGYVPYIVQSGSMSPVIPTGSAAFINTNDKDVEVGDIITYTIGGSTVVETGNGTKTAAYEGQTVTHRLIAIEGDYLFTKGDANDSADPAPVPRERLIGTYLFQIPKLGLFLARTGKTAWFAFGGMLLFLNIASALFSSIGKKDSREPENTSDTDQA